MRLPVRLLVAGCALLVAGCVPAPPPVALSEGLPEALRAEAGTSATQRAAELAVRVRNRACDGVAVGSGFPVASHLLVTNRHVVEGAEELQLDTWDGSSVAVQIHRAAYLYDLAVIETAQPLPRVAELADADPAPGTPVTVVGYPEAGPLRQTRGEVLDSVAGERFDNAGKVLRISALVRHGNSGGPLLDERGKVVGVVYAIETATGDGLAIPVSSLRSVIAGRTTFQPPARC
jgi:S1-C subfamily serine protease